MRTKFEIANNKGEQLIVDGIELLRVMHNVVQKVLQERASKIEKPVDNIFEITTPKSWLDLTGLLYKNKLRHDRYLKKIFYLPIRLKIGEFLINIAKDSKVTILNSKRCYENITAYIANDILEQNNYSDSALASVLLKKLSGIDYPENLSEDNKQFLTGLIVLMFGVEVSRNNTTLLTSLLLLDLIHAKQRYGTRHELFDWKCAFVSRHGYRWDDLEQKPYGGKYPMAQASTGTGNLGRGKQSDDGVLKYGREDFIEQTTDDQTLFNLLNTYPQRHAVVRREISLIIHWLESLSEDNTNELRKSENEKELLNEIHKFLIRRLYSGYIDANADIPWLRLGSEEAILPLTIQSKDVEIDRIQLGHFMNDAKKFKYNKLFHRTDVPCKLVPGWIANGEYKILHENKKIMGILTNFISDKKADEESKCKYCYSRAYPLPTTINSVPNTTIVAITVQKDLHRYRFQDCKVSSQLDGTVNPKNISEKQGLVMFFGQADKTKKCKACFPVNQVDEPSEQLEAKSTLKKFNP